MSSDHKSKFDLEPNPFERSFATKDSSSLSLNELGNRTTNNNDTTSERNSIGSTSVLSSGKTGNSSNKHNLHIPNISSVNEQSTNGKLPGITPPLFTPGGRRLPPLGLSPGGTTSRQYTSGSSNGPNTNGNNSNNPESNLWSGFIGNQNNLQPQSQSQQNFNQFLSNMRKTGLTPNESNIRGFTPGGLNSFGFGNHLVPGLSTPGALLNGPITPGLSSLLGIPPVSMPGMQQQPQQQSTQQQQPPQQQGVPPQQQVPVQQQQQQPQQQGHGMLNPMQSIPPAPEIHAIPAVPEQAPVPVPVSVPVAVPPQTNDIAPPPPPQQQQNAGIHTIPEVPPTTTTFNITPESNTSQDHDTNELNSKPPAGGRKRKNSVKSPTATKKAKTTKGKKKEPKSKVKAEPEADVSKDIADDEREDIDDDEDDQGKDLDNQDSFTDNKPTDEKDTKKTTTARKGKGKKGATDDEEKRKNFLERNRVAASKCRQRKKQLIQKMEDELAFYSTGYRELSAQVTSLRSQLLTLKGVIAGHRDCGAFVQYMGGFDALNELLNQADFATQVTEGVHTNMTSMPSTIPTTLNNVADNGDVSQDAVMPPSAPTTTMAPPLPITNITTANATSTHSNSRTETPDINFVANNNGGGSQLTSHHSLNDLPAAAAAAAAAANNHGGTLGSKISNNGADLRSISSMSNLAAMNGNIAPF